MRTFNFNSNCCVSDIQLPKMALVLIIMFALNVVFVADIDAHRYGGGRGGFYGANHEMRVAHYPAFRGHYRNIYVNKYPSWYYYDYPIWGDYYWNLPPYSTRFLIDGMNYYYADGIYYKEQNEKYKVVSAPIGFKTKELPKNSFELSVNGTTYFYSYGSFYIMRDGQYEVVNPPIGAEVESIPQGYEKIEIDGQTYFKLNNIQYKAVIRNNVIWYQVIKN